MRKDVTRRPIGRRTFIKAAGLTATGFALAVQPISGKTITTPATGLITGDELVPRGGDKVPVYMARPKGKGPFPAVIVIHEIFGQHEHIRDVARRFAHAGYIAAAPELYFREGGVQHLAGFKEILEVVYSVPDRQVLDDLGAVLERVAAMPEHSGKVGTTGFCWGGRITWLFVADNPKVNAGVAWYGRLSPWGKPERQPNSPIGLAGKMNGPVLGLYGGQDRGIPLSDIEAMKAALKKHGKPHQFQLYEKAPHAFFADYRRSYRARAAKDGWRRCLAWFGEHLR
jgi:carboxymethylenebutenolidase